MIDPKIVVTTTNTIEGHTIQDYKGLVSGEAIMGIDSVRDLFASFRDMVGGRSTAYEEELQEAREIALATLERRARLVRANAVVGVSLDYEVVGPNGSMLMVCVNGTAVVVSK